MALFLYTAGLLAASFFIHLLVWRIAFPKKRFGALLLIFTLTPAAVLAAQLLAFPDTMIVRGWRQGVLFFLAYTPTALTYICLYSLLEYESPTLAMIRLLRRAGGVLALDDLRAVFLKEPALHVRLRELEQGGVLIRDARGDLTVAPSWTGVVRALSITAVVLGVTEGG